MRSLGTWGHEGAVYQRATREPLAVRVSSGSGVAGGAVLDRLREEWKDLHRDSRRATAFQSWEWLSSWWEAHGDLHRLRLVEVRQGDADGRLVGLAPLMLAGSGRGPLARLLFVGTGLTDHLDVLVRDGFEEAAGEAMRGAVANMPGWAIADLQDLSPEAAAWEVFGGPWTGARAVLEGQGCPSIEARPEDEVLRGLSKNLRKTVRKSTGRLREEGLSFADAARGEEREAARAVLELHRGSWEGRGIAAAHLSQRFEGHLALCAERLASSGLGGVRELRDRDGTLLMGYLYLAGDDAVCGYLLGVSDEANRRYQTGSLYIWDGLAVARTTERRWLSTLRGLEQYKMRWNPAVRINRRLLLSNPRSGPFGVFGSVAFSAVLRGASARARLSEYARSEATQGSRAARALNAAANTVKTLQRTMTKKKGGW